MGEDWHVIGGGSNSLISDEGVEGTVVRIATRGVEIVEERADGTVLVRVQAGEPWDALVARTVADGLAGLEALSGIPGSTGASPCRTSARTARRSPTSSRPSTSSTTRRARSSG
ncbi:FAD-binding protein [Clavibacter tessellarius]|uniref:FAD-binding protein n=1 Tax=Clavibacter tessellarius TaxID=31965 RepID=UPI003254D55C